MNAPLRVSATLLESFRLYLTEDWFDEADLVAKIKGEFTWTPAMRLGTAYHAVIERPQRALSGYYEQDGFRFAPETVTPMLDKIERGVFEVKTTKSILVAMPHFNEVVLVAKCDHISGSHLSEFKTTLDAFDSEKYMASYQWRIMGWLFEPTCITYHVALLKEPDEENVVRLRSIESLNVFPYPALQDDCRELVRDFVDYLYKKGLDGYLRQKPVYAEVRA